MIDLTRLTTRANQTEAWLKLTAPECFQNQKHCEDGTQERVYWHYGYLVALRDVMRLLDSSPDA